MRFNGSSVSPNAPRENTSAAQFARARRLEAAGRFSAARKAYDALVHNWGASAEAAEAQLSVARLRERAKDFEEAFREYEYYLARYAGAGGAEGVSWSLVVESQRDIALDRLARLQRGGVAAPSSEWVASMFRHVVANAPDSPDAARCVFCEGLAYETDRRWSDAVTAYEKLASRYPRSALVPDAWYRSGACRYEISRRHPNDAKTLANALEVLRLALRTAPGHEAAALTAARIDELQARQTRLAWNHAEFYDRVRGKPDAALLAYRDFLERYPSAPEAAAVRERVAALEAGKAAAGEGDGK